MKKKLKSKIRRKKHWKKDLQKFQKQWKKLNNPDQKQKELKLKKQKKKLKVVKVQEENKFLLMVLQVHVGEEQKEVLVEELVVVKQLTLRK